MTHIFYTPWNETKIGENIKKNQILKAVCRINVVIQNIPFLRCQIIKKSMVQKRKKLN